MKTKSGFTIVELLVVIVVIAIIAAVSVGTFSGVQARASNSAMRTNIRNVVNLFEAYKSTYGDYPAIASYNARMCVGTGYEYGMCNIWGDPVYQWDPSPVNDKLKLVGTPPSSQYRTANGQGGTYVSTNGWSGGGFSLIVWVNGTSADDCPGGFLPSYGFNGGYTCYRNYYYQKQYGV